MNEEMKKLMGKFLFSTVLISCISAFLAGSTAVRERGEYNLYFTKYAVMSFSGASEKLEASFKEKRLSLNIPLEKVKLNLQKYACLTPFSPFYYIAESAENLLE